MSSFRRLIRASSVVLVVCQMAACASPATRLSSFARDNSFQESLVQSERFQHVVFSAGMDESGAVANGSDSNVLNVYLEGDGLPWLLRYIKMKDPTPRRALMLDLMRLDRGPRLYIGRPCYNGLYASDGCDQSMWTSARYSPQVVNSMVSVLKQALVDHHYDGVALFGHSGGGALALLIAEQVPEVRTIVTLAGNLDTDAWIRHHGYSPLYTSLNPAARAPLSESILQIHYVGGKDSNIPPALNAGWINAQLNSFGVAMANYNHSCCWSELWPSILSALEKRGGAAFPGYVFKRPGSVRRALEATD